MMDELKLRSWELPVGCTAPLSAPVDAVTTIKWRGRKVEAKIRAVKIEKGVWWLFFQTQNEWGHNYLVRRRTSWPLEPVSWNAPEPAEKWARLVKMATRRDQFSFARFFFFGAPQNAVCVWNESEIYNEWDCGWIEESRHVSRFDVWTNVQNRNSYEVHQWILKQWQKPNSQVRFAWKWAQMSENSRNECLYEGQRGLNELRRVMRWVLQDAALEIGESWIWDFNGAIHCLDPWILTCDLEQISPQLVEWRDFLFNFFYPWPPLKILKPALCVREWDEVSRAHILAKIQRVSFHERLEARRNLREWLELNAPDQIARLLG